MQQVKQQIVVGWEKESQDKLKLDNVQNDRIIYRSKVEGKNEYGEIELQKKYARR